MEKRKMSKKTIGIAAALLGLVVAVGATAGTTLAKYVTDGSVESTTATVAKWGYTISATNKLFGEYYDTNGDIADTDDNAVIVSSNPGDNIVAPGAHGSASFSINGSSEVNAVLTINFSAFETILLSNGLEDGKVEYYPVKWTVGGSEFTGTTAADLAAKFVDAWDENPGTVSTDTAGTTVTIKIPANSEAVSFSWAISWSWAFEGQSDEYDTLLARLAENPDDTALAAYKEASNTTISFGCTISVVQTMEDFNATVED